MKKINFKCSQCTSTNTYCTTTERICRRCGNRDSLINPIKREVKK